MDFGKAATIRPKIVGETLREIASDKDVASAMFDILETERIIENEIPIELVPEGNDLLSQILAGNK